MARDTYYNQLYEDYEKSQAKLDAVLNELTDIRKEHKQELKQIKKLVVSLDIKVII